MSDIEIHIEELVLHGIDAASGFTFADQIAVALGEAIADTPMPAHARHTDRIATPPVAIAQPPTVGDAGRVGTTLASAIGGVR